MTLAEYQKAIDAMAHAHAVACNQLTERQFSEALRQALACGDFQRFVKVGTCEQAVVYIPFAREQELLAEIERLKNVLKNIGVNDA